jgi:uncharacterized protein YigE (DUF2233 family)
METVTPYEYLSALPRSLESEAGKLIFAINAGMFDTNLKPLGLYVERGANSCTQTPSPAGAIFT